MRRRAYTGRAPLDPFRSVFALALAMLGAWAVIAGAVLLCWLLLVALS